MGKPMEKALVDLKAGWGEVSGNQQSRVHCVSQVDVVLNMARICWLHCGRPQKRTNSLCQHFCVGKSCPPTCALMPDNSIFLCMFLVPFKLLPQ